ncbi:unnamed protein product [Adineta ricciae]|uniref:G-protein coupled receptors family 1 profile domain-containing protein n=1 Tax=Adineta ricciae TaxID=249248 RepID=A0A814NNC3_ADIRI|nr:unnamed protein product [Adineta ricciae]CAF1095305.1 unnamed protein product [Adineta ricciae]
MPSLAQSILVASQQYTIYVSFIILFSGVAGHLCNIFVLTKLKIFRGNPATTYLIAESIVNLFQMLIPFTTRIAMNGFANDLTQTSLLWCKLRSVCAQSSTLISLSIVCFAAIDQYFSTSYHPYLRRLSSPRTAQVSIIIVILLWILHGIPVAIFFEIRSSSGCNLYDLGMVNYVAYVYYLFLTGMIPITISTLFAILAYRNVRRIIRRQIPIRRRKLDQQLTAMIMVRVAFLVVTTLPYVLQRIYSYVVYISKEDAVYRAVIQLVGAITISLFYMDYSGSFYLFLISSARYRRQVRNVFVRGCRVYRARRNQIVPRTQVSSDAYDLQSIS